MEYGAWQRHEPCELDMELLSPFALCSGIDGYVENLMPAGQFDEVCVGREFVRPADRMVAAVHVGLTGDLDWPMLGQYSHWLAITGLITI